MIFGITNIIIGLVNLFVLFIPFLLVLFGEGIQRDFYGSIDWFCSIILGILSWIILYVSSLCLFWSGIALFRMKKYGRKLAIVSCSTIILSISTWILCPIINSIVYHKMNLTTESSWRIIFLSFLLYTILLVTYFMDPEIKKHFNTKNTQEA